MIRAERAQLFGVNSHAEHVTAVQTAENPGNVHAMLKKIAPAAVRNANAEAADLAQSAGSAIDDASYIFEETLALRRLVFPEPPAGRPDGVHILEVDGERYISPWATATR